MKKVMEINTWFLLVQKKYGSLNKIQKTLEWDQKSDCKNKS